MIKKKYNIFYIIKTIILIIFQTFFIIVLLFYIIKHQHLLKEILGTNEKLKIQNEILRNMTLYNTNEKNERIRLL